MIREARRQSLQLIQRGGDGFVQVGAGRRRGWRPGRLPGDGTVIRLRHRGGQFRHLSSDVGSRSHVREQLVELLAPGGQQLHEGAHEEREAFRAGVEGLGER